MTARRPALQLVREGNPGHRSKERLAGGVTLPPVAPDEPDWTRDVFPSKRGDKGQQDRVKRLRGWARAEWRRVVGQLDAQRLLTQVDLAILLDHCVAVALARECYRRIALDGMLMAGERGWQKNGATTILAQQRDRLKHTTTQLGLSPVARDALNPKGSDDDGDDFFD